MQHTDISLPGWMKPLSPKARGLAQLMRLDRPIGTWLLLLPGWWAIAMADKTRWDLFLLFALGAIIMRGAGCVINDLWDHDLDASVTRTQMRPLVSGAVTRPQAYGLLFFLLTLGFAILMTMPAMAVIIGIGSLAFVVSYPLMKRLTWWPQMFLGFTFNFGALLGWAAATGVLSYNALWLYGAGIFWTLGYDTIYAHQDKDDDALVGIRSTARLFGQNSKIWVSAFYATTIALLYMTMPSPALLMPACHFYWQVHNWNMDDPASSLLFFKSNRNAGGLILLASLFYSLT